MKAHDASRLSYQVRGMLRERLGEDLVTRFVQVNFEMISCLNSVLILIDPEPATTIFEQLGTICYDRVVEEKSVALKVL